MGFLSRLLFGLIWWDPPPPSNYFSHSVSLTQDILDWKTSRTFFYWRLRRLLLEDLVKKKIHDANPELTDGQIQAMLRRWFVEVEGTVKVIHRNKQIPNVQRETDISISNTPLLNVWHSPKYCWILEMLLPNYFGHFLSLTTGSE